MWNKIFFWGGERLLFHMRGTNYSCVWPRVEGHCFSNQSKTVLFLIFLPSGCSVRLRRALDIGASEGGHRRPRNRRLAEADPHPAAQTLLAGRRTRRPGLVRRERVHNTRFSQAGMLTRAKTLLCRVFE